MILIGDVEFQSADAPLRLTAIGLFCTDPLADQDYDHNEEREPKRARDTKIPLCEIFPNEGEEWLQWLQLTDGSYSADALGELPQEANQVFGH